MVKKMIRIFTEKIEIGNILYGHITTKDILPTEQKMSKQAAMQVLPELTGFEEIFTPDQKEFNDKRTIVYKKGFEAYLKHNLKFGWLDSLSYDKNAATRVSFGGEICCFYRKHLGTKINILVFFESDPLIEMAIETIVVR